MIDSGKNLAVDSAGTIDNNASGEGSLETCGRRLKEREARGEPRSGERNMEHATHEEIDDTGGGREEDSANCSP